MSDFYFRATKRGERPFETYKTRQQVLRSIPIFQKDGWTVTVKRYDDLVGYVDCPLESV